VRKAFVIALAQISVASDPRAQSRGWKLFFLILRMILHIPSRAARIPKEVLQQRADDFARGKWRELMGDSARIEATAPGPTTPGPDDRDKLAERAVRLARLGEISAARQALVAEPLAPAPLTP
jgi:hypothetical protein